MSIEPNSQHPGRRISLVAGVCILAAIAAVMLIATRAPDSASSPGGRGPAPRQTPAAGGHNVAPQSDPGPLIPDKRPDKADEQDAGKDDPDAGDPVAGAGDFPADEKAAEGAFAEFVLKATGKPDAAAALAEDFRGKYGHTRFFNKHLADLAVLRRAIAAIGHLVPWGRSYYLLVREKVFWHDAKFRCRQLGGHMLTITSAAEQAFVVMRFMNFRWGRQPLGIWLGATDERTEGKWRWITGEEWSYAVWNRGEPNNSGEYEHWAALGGLAGRKWNDVRSTESYWFVCEWEKETVKFTLDSLRELIATVNPTVRQAAAEYKIRLARRVSLTGESVPLQYAVVAILNQAEISYQWEKSREVLGEAASEPIDVNVRNIPAIEALDRILAPLDLGFDVDNVGLFLKAAIKTEDGPG